MSELTENLERVREELVQAVHKAGRKQEEVTLVAVSKLHSAASIRELSNFGQQVFGESYAQEFRDKVQDLADCDVRWHFIGGLQSNKAKYVSGKCELVHSVDTLKLAEALNKKAANLDCVQDILIQVNISGEVQKSGVAPDVLDTVFDEVMALENVRIQGLMTMPPFFDEPERARPVFAKLKELQGELRGRFGLELPQLSMGMSGDYLQAIEEGATLVRVGTSIFGRRPVK
ncbi:MAG: YggS family pyridoxal phosphate-dependent enzyme [Desulfovibrio sp.]